MIGILLESFGVNLPSFLHPYPSKVVPISEKSLDYANLLAQKINSSIDSSDEPLGKKLAFWRNKGVIDIYVVGEKEANLFADSGEMKAMLNRGKDKELIKIN